MHTDCDTTDLQATLARLESLSRDSGVADDIPDSFEDLTGGRMPVRVVADGDRLEFDRRNFGCLADIEAATQKKLAKMAKPRKPRKIKADESYADRQKRLRYAYMHECEKPRKTARLAKGLRSRVEGSVSLRRIPQILAKRVRCGDSKGIVYTEKSKMRALDRKRVTLDMRRLGAWIVDLDRSFKSEWHLKEELARLLPKDFLPNLGVGLILHDGTFVKPHLIFILPPDYEVWTNNERSVEFWHSIHRRLINALLPIGADRAQLANPYKFKNPLCEDWGVAIFSERWHTMSEIAAILPKEISAAHLAREAAKNDGLIVTQGSMAYWTTIGNVIKKTVTDARNARDPSFMASVADPVTRRDWFRQSTMDVVIDLLGAPDEKERQIIDTRTEYAANDWDPNYVDCNRGRDAALIQSYGVKLDPTACRKIAQTVTGRERHDAIIEALARAIIEVTPEGANPFDHRPAIISKVQGLVSKSAPRDPWGKPASDVPPMCPQSRFDIFGKSEVKCLLSH